MFRESRRTGFPTRELALLGATLTVLGATVAAAAAGAVSPNKSAVRAKVLPGYTIRELPPVATSGQNASMAFGLNALGQVVGNSSTSTSGSHATLWRTSGAPADLGTLSGRESAAEAINGRGLIVGYSHAPIGPGQPYQPYHAFLLKGGRMLDLTPQALYGQAIDVNEFGAVVGRTRSSTDYRLDMAFLVPAGGTVVTLADPVSAAYHITERGVTTGYIRVGGSYHAALWRGRLQVDLGTVIAGNSHAFAYAANLFGDLLGGTVSVTGAQSGFIRRNGRTVVIPNLPDLNYTAPWAINNNAVAVGSIGRMEPFRAWLWRNGQPYDLNVFVAPESGWTLDSANDINDLGQIAGEGHRGSLGRGWLLSPPSRTQVANVLAIAARIQPRNGAFQRRVHVALGGLLRRRNLHNGCRSLSHFLAYVRKNRRLAPAERVTLEADVRGIAAQAAKCRVS